MEVRPLLTSKDADMLLKRLRQMLRAFPGLVCLGFVLGCQHTPVKKPDPPPPPPAQTITPTSATTATTTLPVIPAEDTSPAATTPAATTPTATPPAKPAPTGFNWFLQQMRGTPGKHDDPLSSI